MIIIESPLYVYTGKKKIQKRVLNLNLYRNWHYQVSNQVKIKYKYAIYDQIQGLKLDKIHLLFVLYKKTKRKCDRANVLSIHEKFFCDAICDCGCIPDDNDDHILSSHYRTSKTIDKVNPRVDIYIFEHEKPVDRELYKNIIIERIYHEKRLHVISAFF